MPTKLTKTPKPPKKLSKLTDAEKEIIEKAFEKFPEIVFSCFALRDAEEVEYIKDSKLCSKYGNFYGFKPADFLAFGYENPKDRENARLLMLATFHELCGKTGY